MLIWHPVKLNEDNRLYVGADLPKNGQDVLVEVDTVLIEDGMKKCTKTIKTSKFMQSMLDRTNYFVGIDDNASPVCAWALPESP